jgi:hypothetical protein
MTGPGKLKILVWMAGLVLLGGCIIKDSPAPGCRETIGPMMGGCSGKTAILELEVGPVPECLVIRANNCNGGVLEIRNTCTETLVLDGIEINPSDSASLDVKDENGSQVVMIAHGNFSSYMPEEDRNIEVSGVMGDKTIQIGFTKTRPLCK